MKLTTTQILAGARRKILEETTENFSADIY